MYVCICICIARSYAYFSAFVWKRVFCFCCFLHCPYSTELINLDRVEYKNAIGYRVENSKL